MLNIKKVFLLAFVIFAILFSGVNINANTTRSSYLEDRISDPVLQAGIFDALVRYGASVSSISDITPEMIDSYINNSAANYIMVDEGLQSVAGYSSVITNRDVSLVINDLPNNIDFSDLSYTDGNYPMHTKIFAVNKGSLKLYDFNKTNYNSLFTNSSISSGLSVYSGFKNIGPDIRYIDLGYYPYTNGETLKNENLDPLDYNQTLDKNNFKSFKIPLKNMYVNEPSFKLADQLTYRKWVNENQFINQNLETVPAWFNYGALHDKGSTYLSKDDIIKVTLNNVDLEYQMSFDWEKEELIFTLITSGINYDDIKNADGQSSTMFLSHIFSTSWKRMINPIKFNYYNVQLLYNINFVTKDDNIELGNVTLIKKDDLTKKNLSGAEFTLQDENGTILYKNLKTDKNGKIFIKGLAYGEYTFIETNAPKNYIIKNKKTKFKIDKDNTTVSLEVYNTKENIPTPGKNPPVPPTGTNTNLIIGALIIASSLIVYRRYILIRNKNIK